MSTHSSSSKQKQLAARGRRQRRSAWDWKPWCGTLPTSDSDLHLLAVAIAERLELWTADPRLETLTRELGIAYDSA